MLAAAACIYVCTQQQYSRRSCGVEIACDRYLYAQCIEIADAELKSLPVFKPPLTCLRGTFLSKTTRNHNAAWIETTMFPMQNYRVFNVEKKENGNVYLQWLFYERMEMMLSLRTHRMGTESLETDHRPPARAETEGKGQGDLPRDCGTNRLLMQPNCRQPKERTGEWFLKRM